MIVTVQNLVHAISQLNRNIDYNYASDRTRTRLRIHDVALPNGPITIKRYNPAKGERLDQAEPETISTNMIARLAAAVAERTPINVDRLFGGSYNTRSALEALVANTPNFWICYPGRLEQGEGGKPVVKRGHKHIIWLPEPHREGEIHQAEVDMVISESLIPKDVVYEGLDIAEGVLEEGMDIEVARRHAQIQVALIRIGRQLGLQTWIAQNDHGILYDGRRLVEQDGVIQRLTDQRILTAFPDAAHAARLIDAVWFRNGMNIPAVIEVEHSTGVTSGLTRMKGFKDRLPPLAGVRWVIAAEEELRELATREANREQFRDLDARFISYSAVEELYSLCERRKLRGVTDDFFDSFMERLVQP